jgi:AraC-like DNA-binding protein
MRQREDGIERLAAIVALRLLDGRTDIDGAARMAGLGRRTLQRLLDAEGKTYRTLLDRVRMDRARALIRETETPLWEIAGLVGYSDPAHFSRAFSRYFGHPPSSEREAGSRKSSLTAATKTP